MYENTPLFLYKLHQIPIGDAIFVLDTPGAALEAKYPYKETPHLDRNFYDISNDHEAVRSYYVHFGICEGCVESPGLVRNEALILYPGLPDQG